MVGFWCSMFLGGVGYSKRNSILVWELPKAWEWSISYKLLVLLSGCAHHFVVGSYRAKHSALCQFWIGRSHFFVFDSKVPQTNFFIEFWVVLLVVVLFFLETIVVVWQWVLYLYPLLFFYKTIKFIFIWKMSFFFLFIPSIEPCNWSHLRCVCHLVCEQY